MFQHLVHPSRRSALSIGRRTAHLSVQTLEDRTVPSTLDQIFDPPASGSPNIFATSCAYFNTNQEEAQTFTVGLTGTMAEVDLFISRFNTNNIGDLIVDIRACQADGRPTSTGGPLASITVPAASVPGNPAAFFAVDFNAENLAVTAGEQLAVVLHVANDPGANVTYYWEGRSDSQYPGGGFTDRVIGNYDWPAVSATNDLGFKTWVNVPTSQPPVVTLPGGPVSYKATDPPIVLSPSASVTDPDSPNFDTGTLTVSLSANGTVDDQLGIRDQGSGTGEIGVSGNTVSYEGTAIGTFSGGTGNTPLAVTLNASATPTATQALVENLTFGNSSPSASTTDRTVQVVLTDGDGATSDPATIVVHVTLPNQPPVVTTNTGLTVAEGASGIVGQLNLETTDPDNTADQLTYSISAGPSHGALLLNGLPTTTFTQADINAGNVSYTNDGSEALADAFTFTVSDGELSTGSTTFAITVTAVNDPPIVLTNAELIMARGGTATINHTVLDTADTDNTSSQLVYSVSAGPAHGTLMLGGNTVTTFSQADIDAGRISYVNDGGVAIGDEFTFTVSDGTVSTNSATFEIAVDTVPEVSTSPADTAAFAGSPVTLTAGASAIPAPTVQWQVQTPGGSFVDIPVATGNIFSFLPTPADDGNQYRAVFTNPVGSATTTAATLTVTPGLIILAEPAAQTVPIGQTATFSAAATGSTRTKRNGR